MTRHPRARQLSKLSREFGEVPVARYSLALWGGSERDLERKDRK